MRINLLELLQERTIVHPSSISLISSSEDRKLSIKVSGYPWWHVSPSPRESDTLTLEFNGIVSSSLDSDIFQRDHFDEDLEYFDAFRLEECQWAQGPSCEVYMNCALATPIELFIRLHDLLLSFGCPFAPSRYLNMGLSDTLEEFQQICASKSFKIFQGPEQMWRLISDGIIDSDKDCTILTTRSSKDESPEMIFVRIGSSFLICESAYAAFRE